MEKFEVRTLDINDYDFINTIDEYLPYVPGDFFKVILFIYKECSKKNYQFSLNDICKSINVSVQNAMTALTFWEKEKLLECQVNENYPKYNKDDISEFKLRKDVFMHVYLFKEDFGINMKKKDIEKLIFFNKEKKMDIDVLFFILKIMRKFDSNMSLDAAFHSIALWSMAGIKNVKQLKSIFYDSEDIILKMKKVFSMDRDFSDTEMKYIYFWFSMFPEELILEACRRTVLFTNKINLQYAHTILCNWHLQDVIDLNGVKEHDKEWADQFNIKNPGPFYNFPQREYNWEDMELSKSFVEKLNSKTNEKV